MSSYPRSAPVSIPTTARSDLARDPCPHYSPAELRDHLLTPTSLSPARDPTAIHAFSPVFSPVFTHLPNVKPSLLRTTSSRAQTLRRKLLRGSSVLIVQAGGVDKTFIYTRLTYLGVNVYIMDHPASIWYHMAVDGHIAGFIPLDFSDNADILPRAKDAILSTFPNIHFDAITTYYEDAVSIAARLAVELGARANPIVACDAARNKRRSRETLQKAGLPAPRFASVTAECDIKAAAEIVGFPAVLKPAFGAASMGVTRVDSEEDTVRAYRKLFRTMDVELDSIWSQGSEMVLEEYYDGDEFDVDILLSEGKVVYAKVSDNWACREPWFQETGTHCPSTYPADKQMGLLELASEATLALGFQFGAFHVELRWTSRGPRLIEVNGRMGGDPVRDFNKQVWGVDLVEEHCMSALGIPIRPLAAESPQRFLAECVLNAPYSGVMERDGWLDFLLDDTMVYKINYLKKKGDIVSGPEDGVPDWLAEIIVAGEDGQEEVNDRVREIVENEAPVPIIAKNKGSERGYFFPSDAYPFVDVSED